MTVRLFILFSALISLSVTANPLEEVCVHFWKHLRTTYVKIGGQTAPKGDAVFEIATKLLPHIRGPIHLDISHNKTFLRPAPVAHLLTDHPHVTQLDLSHNPLADNFFFFPPFKRLTYLNLSYTGISFSSSYKVGELLSNNDHLTGLSLSGNGWDDLCAEPVAGILRSNNTLKHLNLDHNKLRDRAAKELGTSLANSTLESLTLSHNKISNGGAIALAEALQGSTLKAFDLSHNRIGDKGADAFVRLLSNPSSLRWLYLHDNPFGEKAACDLISAFIKVSPGLGAFTISSTSPEGQECISEAQTKHPNLNPHLKRTEVTRQ